MKKVYNIRNLIIIMLSITIIFMGMGFIFLTIKLKSNEDLDAYYDVSIMKVTQTTPIQGGTTPPTSISKITNDGKTVDFTFNLNYPHDEISYTILIKNNGTIPAKIVKLLAVPDYLNNEKEKRAIAPITITHSDLSNKVLKPKEEIEIKLVATYKISNVIKENSIPYQITIITSAIK